jgi:hypothetical protein
VAVVSKNQPPPTYRNPEATRYERVCATRAPPFEFSAQARYNSTLRIRNLISPECALPSRIVKEHLQPSALHFRKNAELNAVTTAIDSVRGLLCDLLPDL